jgi:ATP-binding cassette subfamily F protein 3
MYARQQKQIKHMQSFVDRFRYKASKAKQAQSRVKMLERMEKIAPAHVDSPFRFRFMEPEKQPQHLLGLTDAKVGYNDTVVLEGINLNLTAGDRIGLLGMNGAGKSTLVKALSSGSTLLDGERHLSKDTRIGYFAQHQLDLLRPESSPVDHLQDYAAGDREQDLRNYLGRFGFGGERIFEPVAPFSGGVKARLVLALMIRQKPNLLLLDEPTNHLDLEMRQALSIALIEYTGALVVISHDRHLLRSVCDELIIVHDGIVERFDRSLDDYPAWIREQEDKAGQARTKWQDPAAKSVNRKQQRQDQAEQRRRLKPLRDKVRDVEKSLASKRKRLTELEMLLADTALYTDPDRKDELMRLLDDQRAVNSAIESLELEWLEASELLEEAI